MSNIRIFVLAKPDIYIDGLIRILNEQDSFDVLQNLHSDNTSVIEELQQHEADMLLLQASLVETPFDTFFKSIKLLSPDMKILVFGQFLDDEVLLNMLRSGANGYVNENMSSDHLIQSIKYVQAGGLWAERKILEELAKDALEMEQMLEDLATDKTQMLSDVLTKREAQVFQWVLKGFSTKEIADQICLSEQSVKLHLGKLFKKFEVTNRSQLILVAFDKVCPITNLIPLIQLTLENRAISYKKKQDS